MLSTLMSTIAFASTGQSELLHEGLVQSAKVLDLMRRLPGDGKGKPGKGKPGKGEGKGKPGKGKPGKGKPGKGKPGRGEGKPNGSGDGGLLGSSGNTYRTSAVASADPTCSSAMSLSEAEALCASGGCTYLHDMYCDSVNVRVCKGVPPLEDSGAANCVTSEANCEGPYDAAYPECESRIQWFLTGDNWKLYDDYVNWGVQPNRCSVQNYLNAAPGEGHCPPIMGGGGDTPAPPTPAPPAPSGDGSEIKVMSFNMKWWEAFDNIASRRTLLWQQIVDYVPDVLGAQECGDRNPGPPNVKSGVNDLANGKFTIDYVDFGSTNQAGLCLLYNTATVRFTGVKGTYGAGLLPEDQYGDRIVMWAEYERLSDGKKFFHFNTHWCAFSCGASQSNWLLSATHVARAIADNAGNAPLMLTGDLNTAGANGNDRGKHARYLTGSTVDGQTSPVVLTDVLGDAGMGGLTTSRYGTIDWIFQRGTTVTDTAIETGCSTPIPDESKCGSDHYPVTATLKF